MHEQIYVVIPSIEDLQMGKWGLIDQILPMETEVKLISGNLERKVLKSIVFSPRLIEKDGQMIQSGDYSKSINYYTVGLANSIQIVQVRKVLDDAIRNRMMNIFDKRSFASSHKGWVNTRPTEEDKKFEFKVGDIIMIISRVETEIYQDEKFKFTTFQVQ